MLTGRSRNAILKGVLTRRSPIYVQFAVSKGCNLRCRMCGAVEARKNEKELSLSEIEQLSNVLAELGVGVLIITGGEPMLRQDLPEIVKIFASKGFDTKLQTNGVLATEEKVKAIVDAGLKDVTISLDTLDEKKQDFINNMQGSWRRAIKALALFSEYLPKKGAMPIINTVVSKLNVNEVPEVVDFTTKIGYYSSIIPVHTSATEGNYIVRKNAEPFAFTKEDNAAIDNLYSTLIRMKKNGYNVHNTYKFLKESANFLKYGKIYWKCDSPDLYFSISPNGTFLPCVDLSGDMSMLEPNFVKRFKSREFRDKIRNQVKQCKGCMYACYPEISFLCKNPGVFAERTFQGIKIARKSRKAVSFEDSLKIIEGIENKRG